MTPLRKKILEEMTLSGLAEGTQVAYIGAIKGLAKHYKQSPDTLTEQQVRSYLLQLRDNNIARGTFKVAHFGLQFLYENVLNQNWPLFVKKRFVYLSKNVFLKFSPMLKFLPC